MTTFLASEHLKLCTVSDLVCMLFVQISAFHNAKISILFGFVKNIGISSFDKSMGGLSYLWDLKSVNRLKVHTVPQYPTSVLY